MALFDISKVRLIQDGEPHAAVTYNRPILDVGEQVSEIIEDFQTFVNGAAFAEIRKPSIIVPTEGQTNFSDDVISSPFQPYDVFYGTHNVSHWQLSDSSEFDTIINTYTGSANLTSWALGGALPTTTYYVRVRYGSDNHYSLWSDPVSFTTSDVYIQKPDLVVSGAPNSVTATPTLTATPFSVFNGTDVHVSTNWKILQGATVVWESMADTVNLTSITVPSGVLANNTEYVFKVSYVGATFGTSPEGSVVTTTLASFITAPTLSATSSSFNEREIVEFSITNYNASLNYVISVDGGTYVRNGANISWTLPSVTADTVYGFYIYATDGTYNSPTTTKSILTINIQFVGDSAVQITDYESSVESNSGYIYV